MKFPCLMYHEIPNGSPNNKFGVQEADFVRQMDFLVGGGYATIDLNAPQTFEGEKRVLITFDDGHKTNFRAAQLLRERGLTATFYVLKDESLGDPDYLNAEQISEISKMGHVIGIHGLNHDWWTKHPIDKLIQEMREVSSWIEDITGKKVVSASAPGGKVTAEIAGQIRAELPGIKYIRSSVPGYNGDHQDELLRSTAILSNTTVKEFERILKIDCLDCLKRRAVYELKEVVKRIIRR